MIQDAPAPPTPALPGDDPRAALVRQVLGSRTFAKSARLSQFFEFVCRKCLSGHSDEINEQQIGIHVFGRSPAYNPTDDSIVRAQARLLRQRLEEYFEHECPACPTIILIPKGGYVPVFERRPEPAHHAEAAGAGLLDDPEPGVAAVLSPAPTLVPVPAVRARRSWSVGWWLLAFTLVLGCAWAVRVFQASRASAPAATLWSSIFTPERPVVIVPSDDGLVLSEELRRAPVSLDEYLSGSYLQPEAGTESASATSTPGGTVAPGGPLTPGWLSSHQYTSTADLNLAMRLNRLPEAATARVETRYARLLRLGDLKNNNIILIGGVGANPWVSLFARELNFDVNYDWKTAQGYVINKQPHGGEQARYFEDHGDHSARSYGVLAYLPGIAGQGSALLFEGSGMAGTEAASDFPFSGEAFSRFVGELKRQTGGGRLPYFEVLLQTQSLGGNGPEAQVLAWRVVQP